MKKRVKAQPKELLVLPDEPKKENLTRTSWSEDLMSAVKPLILPFEIVVVIGSNQSALESYYKDMTWSDVKY